MGVPRPRGAADLPAATRHGPLDKAFPSRDVLTAALDEDFCPFYGVRMETNPALPSADNVTDGAVTVVPKVSVGMGWEAVLEPRDRGALLRLQNAERGTVNIEIVLTAEGPVIRASVCALKIRAETDVRVSCDRFLVEARESFGVRAPEISHEAGGVFRATAAEIVLTARAGDVAIRANDDVSVHGEQILLNCDRDPPVPAWLPRPPAVETTLPASPEYGDPAVLRDLAKD